MPMDTLFYCSHYSLVFTFVGTQNETNRFKAEDGGSLCFASIVGKTILIRQLTVAGAVCS
jgi:hypothetical protein